MGYHDEIGFDLFVPVLEILDGVGVCGYVAHQFGIGHGVTFGIDLRFHFGKMQLEAPVVLADPIDHGRADCCKQILYNSSMAESLECIGKCPCRCNMPFPCIHI